MIISSNSPGRAWKTSARISLAVLQLDDLEICRQPGLAEFRPSFPGPPHEYASSVLWAPGTFASPFLPFAGACSL